MKKINQIYGVVVLALFFQFIGTLWSGVARAAEESQAAPVVAAQKAAVLAANNNCECPKLSCDSMCEIEQDLTFYSEKCAGGTRVMSCARPTCVKIESAPASCGQVAKAPVVEPAVPSSPEPAREVASLPGEVVGRVKFVEGEVKKVVSAKERQPLNVGDEIRERDRIATEANSKAQIQFNSGNLLNITPDSEIVISEASDSVSKSEKKKMILDLIKGKVRNKVNQKYDGEQSYYRIRVGAAVAGVRGTDFAVSIHDDGLSVTSKIETLEGAVELSDDAFVQKVSVGKGEGASFVASKAAMAGQAADPSAPKGQLGAVYKMTMEQMLELDESTNFALLDKSESKRVVASAEKPKVENICASPSAQLNQCAWTCENNPAGEKRCRTDLPGVSCVRRVCNANGLWSEPTRLPASYHEACRANVATVKPCDY